MQPLVSIIIPVFNSAETIHRSLNSVLKQTYKNFEIIIIDDCSTDSTINIIQTYDDKRINILKHSENKGASYARNTGIKNSKGEYLAFLDSDDEWLPNKLAEQMQLFNTNKHIAIVTCNCTFKDQNNKVAYHSYDNAPPVSGAQAWKTLLQYSFIATPSVILNKAYTDNFYFNTALTVAEDQDMWIRSALSGEVAYIQDALVNVYIQPNSLMATNTDKEVSDLIPMIEKHVTNNTDKLTKKEIKNILGGRYIAASKNQLYTKNKQNAKALALKAIKLNYKLLKSTLLLAKIILRH